MRPAVKPIPDSYPRVTPYLYIDGASDAIEFYETVLGATERMRIAAPEEMAKRAAKCWVARAERMGGQG